MSSLADIILESIEKDKHKVDGKYFETEIRPNMYYNIIKSDPKKFRVAVGSNYYDNPKVFLSEPVEEYDDQKWIFFKLDGGLWTIANKKTGEVMAVVDNQENIKRYAPLGCADQKWIVEERKNVSKYAFMFKNDRYGTKMGVADSGNLCVYDEDSYWFLGRSSKIYEPQLKSTSTLGSAPEYNGNNTLPDETALVLVSTSLVPYFAVKDNSWKLSEQIKTSPYYILERYESWEKASQESLPSLASRELKITLGIKKSEQVTIQETVGITIGADCGMSFEGASASVSESFTQGFSMTTSNSKEEMKETEDTTTVKNPSESKVMDITKYIKKINLVIKRQDGTEAMRTVMRDKNSVRTTQRFR